MRELENHRRDFYENLYFEFLLKFVTSLKIWLKQKKNSIEQLESRKIFFFSKSLNVYRKDEETIYHSSDTQYLLSLEFSLIWFGYVDRAAPACYNCNY